MFRRLLSALILFFVVLCPGRADVIISEFLANNNSGLTDEDGAHSDWIELFNNGAANVNLLNWRLTDQSGNLARWVFPSVDLPPNGLLVVFASNKNRTNPAAQLHTNFKLSASGGYLALVRPDLSLSTVFNPYPAQYPDKPYGFIQTVSTTTYLATNAALKSFVPTANPLPANWTTVGFNDASWTSGTNAAGFETTVNGWLFHTVFANTGNVGSAAIAETVLITPSQQTSSTTVNHPVINWNNSGSPGHYTTENPPPALNTAVDLNDYIVEGTGTFTISATGIWTFCIGSDDGCKLQIRPVGGAYTTVIGDPGQRGMSDSVGTYNFTSVGDYEIRALIYERGGGSGGEVSARAGSTNAWDSNFHLIGDTASGGLAIRSLPQGGTAVGGYGSLIGANLLAPMYNANPRQSSVLLRFPFTVANPATITTLTMLMQYDDGFVAYLNGVEIGRRNVPAGALNYNSVASTDRANNTVLVGESLDLTGYKNFLVTGANVLAIHGLNSAATDGDLLLRPQIAQYTTTTGALAYFTTATPGAFNTATVYNRVAPIIANLEHGFFSTTQSLTLTCGTAGATIYYTYDGSMPSATNPAAASGVSPLTLSINSTRVVRAVAVKATFDNSDVFTRTYLFPADVITQSPTGAPPAIANPAGAAQGTTTWPVGPINGQILDYGMDPTVVNSPNYSGTIINDLKSIPTISITTDKENLFNPNYGIYVNPGNDGDSNDPSYPDPISPPQNWERRSSIELINPDGSTGFQANCGIRIRGGFSRSTGNPKHGLRVFFREEYGAGKLTYDLHKNAPYGAGAAQEFVKFDLRCANNYSWSFGGDGNGTFIPDPVARDMQLATGHPSSHGAFYHLYLNGQYWGLYNIDERPDANFGATYFGGDSSEYDAIKIDPDNGYNLEATDGTVTAWTAYWTLADQTLRNAANDAAKNAVYQQMKGNNPDGSANPAYPVYLNDTSLIDEMLVVYYGGNLDALISAFLNNTSANNVFSIRSRLGTSGGWQGVLHDSEHTLLNAGEDRTGPWDAGNSVIQGAATALDKSTQQYVFQQLVANSTDFRTLFTDRVYKQMANGGPLTPAGALAIFDVRKAEIDRAVVGESARWGDAKTSPALTRDGNWIPAINNTRNNFFPTRTANVIAQYRTRGWYPSFDPPVWSQRGGTVAAGATITLTLQPNQPVGAAIYYTTDGSDPRAPGGALGATAILYSGPIIINNSKVIRTRVKVATAWSALDEATFFTSQAFTGLALTEINYNPPPTIVGGTDGGDYEFLEFKNTSATTIDLGGVNFTSGITFTFPAGTTLAPGQFFLLVKKLSAFTARYPAVTMVAGTYGVITSGSLDNSGEKIALASVAGTPILAVTYDHLPPWPVTPDGNGFSLVPNAAVYNSDLGTDWRASAALYGSPRADDPVVNIAPILVNELLSNSALPVKDAIELYNPTAAPVSVADWWLTDDANVPKKYRIPAGTTIPAGGYLSFTEDQFNPGGAGFAFSSAGDDAYLFSGNSAGNLTGYAHGFTFAGGELNRSFGRYLNSVGEEKFPRQTASTFGAANAGPLVGPLVISEIMYNPYAGYDEYVEIRNTSASAVPLYDPANPANTWKVGGIGYTFPTGQSLNAGAVALIVGIDPATFRTKYGIPAGVPIYGPYAGSLQDSGELLTLEMPDTPVLNGQGLLVLPYDVIDGVRYNDKAPWPNAADGSGPSLQRLNVAAFGDDPANWYADGVTPGAANSVNAKPAVALTSPAAGATYGAGTNVPFTATATDADGSILKVEYYSDGVKIGESATGPDYPFTWVAAPGAHSITARALDNSLGTTTSAARTLFIAAAVVQGLKAEYFSNATLTGAPSGIRTDGPIDFSDSVNSWPTAFGFPSVTADHFSVRWSGQIRLPVTSDGHNTGPCIFQTTSDEGIRLIINSNNTDISVINNWNAHTLTNNNGAIFLNEGQLYDIRLEYYDNTGVGVAKLSYTPFNSNQSVVPASVLYPDGAPIIITHPTPLTREQGTVAAFTVESSAKNLTYQWQKNGVDVAGATASTFTIPYCTLADAGSYTVLVNNPSGFAISNPAALTVTFTDTDGDGIPDSWETANGFNPGSAADANLDTDGDGFSNKAEYLAGTNPRNPQSRPGLGILKAASGPGFTLSFVVQPYRTYSIQARESLTTGSWSTIQSYTPFAATQTVTFTDPTTLPVRHYRVVTP